MSMLLTMEWKTGNFQRTSNPFFQRHSSDMDACQTSLRRHVDALAPEHLLAEKNRRAKILAAF